MFHNFSDVVMILRNNTIPNNYFISVDYLLLVNIRTTNCRVQGSISKKGTNVRGNFPFFLNNSDRDLQLASNPKITITICLI